MSMPRKLLALLGALALVQLCACGVKDDPEPPSGKKNVPAQVYPKPDAMPGAAPPPPPPARRS